MESVSARRGFGSLVRPENNSLHDWHTISYNLVTRLCLLHQYRKKTLLFLSLQETCDLLIKWVKKRTIQFELAVRVRLNVENISLILKPQSTIFWINYKHQIKIRGFGIIFDTFFMFRVSIRVIKGNDVTLDISPAVRIIPRTVLSFFSSTCRILGVRSLN